ncbi:MAG: hypothetical protein Q4D17_04850 [Planctomycetia bacterium]|nr:hypothetical protein [Planctomycetia bacterium]
MKQQEKGHKHTSAGIHHRHLNTDGTLNAMSHDYLALSENEKASQHLAVY